MDSVIVGKESELFVQATTNESNVTCVIPSFAYFEEIGKIVVSSLKRQGKYSATPEELAAEYRAFGWTERLRIVDIPEQNVRVQFPGEAEQITPFAKTRTLMTLTRQQTEVTSGPEKVKLINFDYVNGLIAVDANNAWATTNLEDITPISKFEVTAKVEVA